MPETMPQPDLFPAQKEEGAKHIYKVSEIVGDIKIILENSLPEVWVEGEVSNFSAHPSGHFYFTLKDDAAVLPGVMFARVSSGLKFKIENGLKIICFGKISAYGPHGKYQIIAEKIEPKGIGSLQLALEQLKARLEKEGLFRPEHKKPIPYLPSRIGVVTSLQGAAIKDILKVLDRRFGDIHVIIKPVAVQGEGAKDEIASGIKELNSFNEAPSGAERIEVMIVGRGGGSIEDLWAFNEEIVARAIYGSRIPVISAVGHERDWTIADLVADLRAATPSVAAEIVIPEKEGLKEKLSGLIQSMSRSFLDTLLNFKEETEALSLRLSLGAQNALRLNAGAFEAACKKLSLLNPALLIQQHIVKIADLARQIYVRMQHGLRIREAQFIKAAEKLSGLSPLNILGRGYSITFKMPDGAIIKDMQAVKTGDTIKTKLHKGEIVSKVIG